MAFSTLLLIVWMATIGTYDAVQSEPPSLTVQRIKNMVSATSPVDLDFVKALILQGLHLSNPPPPRSRIQDEVLRDRLKWDYAHDSFAQLKGKATAIYLMPQARLEHKQDEGEMMLEFHFRLKAFESKLVANATINMYKSKRFDGSPVTTIAVAEVLGQSRHEINVVAVDSIAQGWISIDITGQVLLWASDFDNGEPQVRVLHLYCIYCKETLTIRRNGLFHPYIKVDLLETK